MMKKVKFVLNPPDRHWVGNGFYVYPSIRPEQHTYPYTTPFILMDYAAPMNFSPTSSKKGVGEHPHRGFETVTFAIQGEVDHKDSSGGGGTIKSGDIQWMTAGRGIVHEEFHSKEFALKGGTFEMVQLWVNLPSKFKMTKPSYQDVKGSDMPIVKKDKFSVKVVAGEYESQKGPSKSFTPMNIYEVNSNSETNIHFDFKNDTTSVILILTGTISVEDQIYNQGNTLVFDRQGEGIQIHSKSHTKLLVLNANPIDEPIVAHGPFVMNTRQEIIQAIHDYQNGKMGQL